MQGARPSHQQLSERRMRLLRAAWTLAQTEGLLAVRVSQVAKRADVSIGTFYAHFPTKEDLVVQLASQSWAQRLALLTGLPSTCSAHAMVTVPLMELVYGARHPILVSAEQLAATPTIWARSTQGSRLHIRDLHRKMHTFVRTTIDDAIDRGLIDPGVNANALERSIWMLSMGGAYVREATLRLEGAEPEEVPSWFLETVRIQLRGVGWTQDSQLDEALAVVLSHPMQRGIWRAS